MRTHTTHTRDAALRQLRRVNRWVLAGSVVLTGLFTEAAALAFPGKTTKTTHRSSGGSRSSAPSVSSQPPLAPPSQAPSGGSGESPSGESESQPSAPTPEGQAAPPEAQSSEPQQGAPSGEAAPQGESSSREAAPESSGPVVSGGS